MDDAFAVGRLESLGELTCDLQRLGNRNRSGREAIRERRAFDQLEDQCEPAVDLFDAVDCGNVGMIERGEQARFAFEARAPVRIVSEHRRQQLDGDIASEARIARTVHLTHAAGAKRPGDLEHAQPNAGREWRGRQHTTQHWHRRAVQKSARTFVRRQQRFNFTAAGTRRPHTPARETRSTPLADVGWPRGRGCGRAPTRELHSSPFAPEFPEEPCPRQRPITVHRGGRDAHDRCCLVDRQPAEESQLHQLALPRIEAGKFLERGVEVEHVDFRGIHHRLDVLQRHPLTAVALRGPASPRVVDKDAAHHVRGNRKEMRAVLPPDLSLVDQLEIRLVDKGRGGERVVGALAAQVTARQPAQFVVDGVDQTASRRLIARTPSHEQVCQLCVVRHTGLRPAFISELRGNEAVFRRLPRIQVWRD